MNYFEHPLFLVFAFTVLAFLAGRWWFLRGKRERADHKPSTGPLREAERAAVEVQQDIESPAIALAQHGPVSADSVDPDKKEARGQILRREETMSRLALLSDLIAKQNSRISSARTAGLDVTLLEEHQKVLTDSREEYYLPLKHLLLDTMDGENAKGGQ